MREFTQKILDSLAFRIITLLSVVVLLAGLGLYLFTLRSVSEFADINIKDNILALSREIYNISDDSMTALIKTGQLRDEKALRINKAFAVGLIEDYMKENNLKGFILEGKNEILSAGGLSPELSDMIEEKIREYTVSRLEFNGTLYYVTHAHFDPWDWHILLAKEAADYSALENKVVRAYRITAVILLAAIILSLYVLNRYIRNPISRIITRLKKGERPEYKGIAEFEFLSDSISRMMDSMQQETKMLNTLYDIAVSKRGESFFKEVTKAINSLFGLNAMLGEIRPDGETVKIVAMCYQGQIKKSEDLPLKDVLFKRGHTDREICIIENEAYKKLPVKYLADIKADLLICLKIFGRKDNAIGVVNAFGRPRTLTPYDLKIFKAIGQIVGTEFELLQQEKEKELMKERIFQMQKLEALGTLAGGIAHDFNNMLQGILGYAAFLKMKVQPEDPMYEPLSVIEHSAERAADLTKKLLGFARKGKYVIAPLNLNNVAKDAIAIISRTFNKAIKIETTFASGLPVIEGDKSQLENVILNLCLNAQDAMPAGGILNIETCAVELAEDAKPYAWMKAGIYAVLKVTDTGRGMPEDIKKRIFEPFFTTKAMGKGTGMGLAMVYGVVKNHQGFITVDSAVGQGSTFTIYLPASGKKTEEKAAVAVSPPHGKGTILVVDDEKIIRDIAGDMLRELSYNVLLAAGGKEAVAIYADKKDSIDLVIVDMIMPGMGGQETFNELKKINPDAKIIISSGYSRDSQEEGILDVGEAGFIQKPYNLNELAEIIKEVLTAA